MRGGAAGGDARASRGVGRAAGGAARDSAAAAAAGNVVPYLFVQQGLIVRRLGSRGVVRGEEGAPICWRLPSDDAWAGSDVLGESGEAPEAAAQLEGGIKPEMVRLSVGIETADDIIADIDAALAKALA